MFNRLVAYWNRLDTRKASNWLLRLGLAAVFLYAAGGSLLQPVEWLGFLPAFLRELIPGVVLLVGFALYELALAIWLLSGKFIRYAALLCALTLIGIMAASPDALIITFRDIGLIFMALALFVNS